MKSGPSRDIHRGKGREVPPKAKRFLRRETSKRKGRKNLPKRGERGFEKPVVSSLLGGYGHKG